MMKKPELVTIAKRRLVGVLAQQCEKMDETTLREKLESLVGIYFICDGVNTHLTQRTQQ